MSGDQQEKGSKDIPVTPIGETTGSIADQVNTLAAQVIELQRRNAEEKERNARLEDRMERAESNSAPDTIMSGKPSVTEKQIETFLTVPRPLCEYFNLTLCTYQMQVFHDRILNTNQQTGHQQRKPALWMQMSKWGGPGAEFKAENHYRSDKFRLIGYWNAAMDTSKLVTVTEGDVKEYRLLPPHSSNAIVKSILISGGEHSHTLAEVIKQVESTDDYRNGVFISGEMFQQMMKAEYDKLWAGQRIDENLKAKMKKLTPAAMKAGMPV